MKTAIRILAIFLGIGAIAQAVRSYANPPLEVVVVDQVKITELQASLQELITQRQLKLERGINDFDLDQERLQGLLDQLSDMSKINPDARDDGPTP